MNCVKLYKLYRMIPSLSKVLDKVLFSEPFIEKFSTFEMKSLVSAYGIAVGIFVDKRANKITRNILITYHIGCTLLASFFCIFYLTDLLVYDVETVAFGILPLIMTTNKLLFLGVEFYLFDVIEKLLEFFVSDYNRANSATSSVKASQGCINMKKWVITVCCMCFGFHFCADVFFSLENQMKLDGITKRPHLMKFFPVWCPFENWWAKMAVSLFQDAIVLPEAVMYFFVCLSTFISVIEMHNKFRMLLVDLKTYSERTFERIEIFDRQLEEAMCITNERTRSNIIKGLEEERMYTIGIFYHDFVRCVKRFQELQSAQVWLKIILNYFCSISYCLILSIMIGFAFVGTEALSNIGREFEFIMKMGIWFSLSGIVWYMICVIGELFSQQNDSFAEEAYSMPWYYFNVKQRKTVFTLLTLIQKPVYLRALKLVDVKKETLPDFLNSVYSYVQIMQTLQQVKHRHT